MESDTDCIDEAPLALLRLGLHEKASYLQAGKGEVGHAEAMFARR